MNLKKYLFFTVLGLLLLSTPGSAEDCELSFEGHPYDSLYSLSGAYISEIDNTNQLSFPYTSPTSFYLYGGFDSDLYFTTYYSLCYSGWDARARLYDDVGSLLGTADFPIKSGAGYHRIHFVRNDLSLLVYVDDVYDSSCSLSSLDPISYINFELDNVVDGRIDDISTTSYYIGHTGYVKPADNIIYFTVNTPEIDGYSYYVQMCDPNGAELKRWNVTSFRDTCNYTPSLDLTDDGLYYLYVYGQDDKLYYSKPFLYTSATVPADVIFKASGTANVNIRDSTNQGGEIESGGERYLYMTEDEGGNYPINVTLLEEAFSFTFNHELVYAMHDVNSTQITFEELQSNYKVTLDGQTFPSGAAATGSFTFTGNLTDGDTLNISADRYEFDSDSNTTNNTIPVPLNASNLSISTGNLLEKIQTNGTADISADLTVSEETGGGSGATGPEGYYYTAEITITNPSDQEGYQAAFNISQLDGMQDDGEDIRFYAENGSKLSYWIDPENTVNGSYYVGYVRTPADATNISLYYGNNSAISKSNGAAVFELYDDFNDNTINSTLWDTEGTVTLSNGLVNGRIASKTSWSPGYTVDFSGKTDDYFGGWETTINAGTYYLWRAETSIALQASSTYIYSGISSDSELHTFSLSRKEDDAQGIVDGQTLDWITSYSDLDMKVGTFGGSWDWVIVRKYEATEPTFSIGTPESLSTTTTAKLSLTANTPGTAGNLINISTNATNISASGPFLTGGRDSLGYTNGATTWSYNITDWTTVSEHIFEFTPDLTLPGVYGYVKDPDTQQALRTATVTIFNDSASFVLWTDSNGMYYKTTDLEAGQTYSVKAAKSGYTTFEGSATTKTGATTKYDFFLSPEEGSGLYYSPHYVQFVIESYLGGSTYSGVNVTVYSDSTRETEFGSKLTDDRGIVGWEMSPDKIYYFTITDPEQGINKEISICPGVETIIHIPVMAGSSYEAPDSVYDDLNWVIYKNQVNLSSGFINVSVEQTTSETVTTNITITDMNSTALYTQNYTTTPVNYSVLVPTNQSYIVFVNINHPDHDPVKLQKSVTWNMGINPDFDLGWEKQWQYSILAAISIILIVMLFPASLAHIGGLLGCGAGAFHLFVTGWLPADTINIIFAFLAIMLAFMFNSRKQEVLR